MAFESAKPWADEQMRSPQASKAMIRRSKWTIDTRTTVLVAIFWLFAALLLAFLYRRPPDMKWVFAQGNIQGTRIVADHALQTKWGGQLTWKAEYRVAYSVAGREYAVRADSGIRGADEAGVQLALPQSHPSCLVQYNPGKPEASVADCR
jgi:hypothetical protein